MEAIDQWLTTLNNVHTLAEIQLIVGDNKKDACRTYGQHMITQLQDALSDVLNGTFPRQILLESDSRDAFDKSCSNKDHWLDDLTKCKKILLNRTLVTGTITLPKGFENYPYYSIVQ